MSYHSWLPRLSSTILVDLRLWMMGFGLLIGLMFPFVVVLLGVPRDITLRPIFFAAIWIAGLVVAEVNHALARAVVGVRLRSLAGSMQHVEESLVDASDSGDWGGCDPEACMVPVDSTDGLGEVAASFNRLVTALSTSHQVDLDHFKAINDSYGHLVGDRVLQTEVGAVRRVLREGDVLPRYGGEKFIIVLPGEGRDDLMQMAERVRRAVADAEITEA